MWGLGWGMCYYPQHTPPGDHTFPHFATLRSLTVPYYTPAPTVLSLRSLTILAPSSLSLPLIRYAHSLCPILPLHHSGSLYSPTHTGLSFHSNPA